ncbi:hypothetical protein OT109_00730 [Phycisphaeraceae bacterium D3-23]
MNRTALLLGAAMAVGYAQRGMADVETVALTGDWAGGVPFGTDFDTFGNPVLNDAGQVAYLGLLEIGSGDAVSSNNSGLWVDSTLVAREGSQAGGTPAGSAFDHLSTPLVLNNAGELAYSGVLRWGAGGGGFNKRHGALGRWGVDRTRGVTGGRGVFSAALGFQ